MSQEFKINPMLEQKLCKNVLRNFLDDGYNLKIGKFSYGKPNLIWEKSQKNIEVEIGSFVSIADNVTIFVGTSGRHTTDFLSTFPMGMIFGSSKNKDISEAHNKDLSVHIGSDVWIGRNVTIMAGVKIGNGSVIGVGAVVTKDIPSYSVYGGIPAKKIRDRFDENTKTELEKIEWWNLNDELIYQNRHIFSKKNFLPELLKLSQNNLVNKLNRDESPVWHQLSLERPKLIDNQIITEDCIEIAGWFALDCSRDVSASICIEINDKEYEIFRSENRKDIVNYFSEIGKTVSLKSGFRTSISILTDTNVCINYKIDSVKYQWKKFSVKKSVTDKK